MHEHLHFRHLSPSSLAEALPDIAQAFVTHGVAVLPGFFRNDPLYEAFVADLRAVVRMLQGWAGIPAGDGTLAGEVTRLAAAHRPLAGKLYDLGTRPNKLVSGMMLKTHPALVSVAREVFGTGAVLATPTLSDTLHVFPPPVPTAIGSIFPCTRTTHTCCSRRTKSPSGSH